MIGALGDPYSQYMTSDEFKASLQGLAGQFEGIGATIGTVDADGRHRVLRNPRTTSAGSRSSAR